MHGGVSGKGREGEGKEEGRTYRGKLGRLVACGVGGAGREGGKRRNEVVVVDGVRPGGVEMVLLSVEWRPRENVCDVRWVRKEKKE